MLRRREVLLFLVFLLVGFLSRPPELYAESFYGRVTRIADGDTIHVLRNDGDVTVRLHGIDCPEKSQPFGREAGRFAAEMVSGKRVLVRVMDIDRYGRLVGIVSVDNEGLREVLNEFLVAAGLAWWYRQYAPGDRNLARLEETARREGRGLWGGDDPIPPWEWRRGVRSVSAADAVSDLARRRDQWFDAERELRYDPEGPDRDCGDFRSRREAQIFFEAAGGPERDPHRLDSDGDGQVCEGLPW